MAYCVSLTEGLISNLLQDMYLWNPSIRKLKMLSDCCLSHSCQYTWFATGFGYHSDTNDYKVVKLICSQDASFNFDVPLTVAEVYTLSSDSWKRVVVPLEPNGGAVDYVYDVHLFATFVSGALNWLITLQGERVDRDQVIFVI